MEPEDKHNKKARKRPQECMFCGKTFYRSDILHRHYKRCSSRGIAPIPQPLKRGKKRRACDACARSRLSCDSDSPCETCLMNGLPCTYLRVRQDNSPVNLSFDEHLTVPKLSKISDLYRWSTVGEINQAILVAVTRIPKDPPASIDRGSLHPTSHGCGQDTKTFLLNYIDPKVRSVTDTFGYTTGLPPGDPEIQGTISTDAAERLGLSLAYYPVILRTAPFDLDEVSNLLQPATSDDQLLLEYFFAGEATSEDQPGLDSNLDKDRPWTTDPHVTSWNCSNGLTDDLMYYLHEFCATLPAGHPEGSPNYNLTQGLELISPSNIKKFLNLYFHHWNRHSPIIHHATFDPEKASSPLLFAIILTGALFSTHDEAGKARNLLGLAEEFAFQNKPFEKLLAGSTPDTYDDERMSRDALQAAFSVAQIQLREGSASVRKNARSKRFGQVVTATRTAGLMNARNTFFHSNKLQARRFEDFGWDEFCHSEARIRFICGLFALDTSFTIFYNMTPRISLEELRFDKPCSLESYCAKDAETCYRAATAELASHLPQMGDVQSLSFTGQTNPHMNPDTKPSSVLDFYVIILILLRKIWALPTHEAHMPEEPTNRALSQWKTNWDVYITEMTLQQSELSGFTKQAAIEFWHLSNIIRKQPS